MCVKWTVVIAATQGGLHTRGGQRCRPNLFTQYSHTITYQGLHTIKDFTLPGTSQYHTLSLSGTLSGTSHYQGLHTIRDFTISGTSHYHTLSLIRDYQGLHIITHYHYQGLHTYPHGDTEVPGGLDTQGGQHSLHTMQWGIPNICQCQCSWRFLNRGL